VTGLNLVLTVGRFKKEHTEQFQLLQQKQTTSHGNHIYHNDITQTHTTINIDN